MHVDGAAVGEAQLFEQVLHDDVVPMRINADMAVLFIGPVQAESSDSLL